jgi:hypothetical protein
MQNRIGHRFQRRLDVPVWLERGGQGFLPTDLDNLALWLVAGRITGLNNGDPVATWPDISGNGRNAIQAAAGQRPLYMTGIANGLPVVRFDGVDDTMRTALFGLVQPEHVFTVFQQRDAVGAGTFIDGDGPDSMTVSHQNAIAETRIFAGGVVLTIASDLVDFHTWTCLFNGAGSLLRQDGGGEVSGNIGASNANRVRFGSRGVDRFSNVDIAEVIIYSDAKPAGEQAEVEAYLISKYAT